MDRRQPGVNHLALLIDTNDLFQCFAAYIEIHSHQSLLINQVYCPNPIDKGSQSMNSNTSDTIWIAAAQDDWDLETDDSWWFNVKSHQSCGAFGTQFSSHGHLPRCTKMQGDMLDFCI